jgi:hypothetical protein
VLHGDHDAHSTFNLLSHHARYDILELLQKIGLFGIAVHPRIYASSLQFPYFTTN